MAIYINKEGTKVDEKVVGAKSAQDWASQGFSAYTEPVAPTVNKAPTVNQVSNSSISVNDLITPKVNPSTIATPADTRKLGETEFKNLSQGWTNLGLTSQEIEENFLTRQGSDIYLKTKAPSHQEVLAKRPVATPTPTGTTDNKGVTEVVEAPKTIIEKKEELINNFIADKATVRDTAKADAGVEEATNDLNLKQQKADEIMGTVEKMQADLNLQDLLNEEDMLSLEKQIKGGGPVLASTLNARLNRGLNDLSQEQRLERLYDTYSLNTQINAYNAQNRAVALAQGKYNQAMDNVKETVDDWTNLQTMKLDLLTEQGQLEKEERAWAEKEIEFERDLRLKGYTYIENPDTYNKIVKDLGITAGNFNQFIYKDVNGKMYLKPDEMSELEIYARKKEIDNLYENNELSISEKIALKKEGYILDEYGNIIKGELTKEEQEAEIAQKQTSDVLKTKINDIKTLLSGEMESGFEAVVGTNKLTRTPLWTKLTGEAQEFAGGVKQLIAKETIDTLVNLKARGGTLGALSDTERIMLQNAASKLGAWEIKDKNGNGTGRWDIDEKAFKKELESIKTLTEKAYKNATGSKYIDIDDFLQNASDDEIGSADMLKTKYPGLTDDDIIELINDQSFSRVGGDTNKALSKVVKIDNGEKGGQCGRFVNKITGLGLGDSYQSKIAKMDKSITRPAPGMVFVMPYGKTGHTGFILGIDGDEAIVKDSNYSLDEKVKTHKIPINKITGLRRV